ncbi:IucA/IucC family protein [Fodinicola acaciae]|uniref:IucA/IucC family protein n=1 Tax=Fodinicola acaciae TaxID=2681555 RepID=UPI0013D57119|nr:IucA/IucC family siderophore biosynthesis protein [Fodinicola acaciae]
MSLYVPDELTADRWAAASRRMLAKALGEFSYEELLSPVETADNRYAVELSTTVSYVFTAKRGAYGSWQVDPDTIVRVDNGIEAPADDALRFVFDAGPAIGLSGDTTGHLIRELSATLSADTRIAGAALPVEKVADLPYAELEGYQTGHPWIVPNKGRLGFSATDAATYPPEARQLIRLPWIAVHRDIATYRFTGDLAENRLYETELDAGTRSRFTEVLTTRGLDPADYLWLPVHPWQWDDTILPLFAADVAAGRIVALGDGSDDFRAQQSIRTFSNVTSPRRHHVKLPLSVLNTLVWRGLPTERTVAAPAVTEWVLGIRDRDPFLRDESRPVLLGEVASVTVRHDLLESVSGVPYQYLELLGAIWRQPLAAQLDDDEHARTLAALLYVDPDGRPLVGELVRRSGLPTREWLERLAHAMLPPLLHFLYQYGVVFSPHGENAIVVFDENDVPTRLAVKDFVDDVNVSAAPLPELAGMPEPVDTILLREPPEFLCQFIHSGLFVGHFRYLAERVDLPQDEFWSVVRAEILAYQAKFPQLAERFAMFDLLTERIERLCLNRNRLLLDGYRDRPERPHAAVHGTVPNPLAVAP